MNYIAPPPATVLPKITIQCLILKLMSMAYIYIIFNLSHDHRFIDNWRFPIPIFNVACPSSELRLVLNVDRFPCSAIALQYNERCLPLALSPLALCIKLLKWAPMDNYEGDAKEIPFWHPFLVGYSSIPVAVQWWWWRHEPVQSCCCCWSYFNGAIDDRFAMCQTSGITTTTQPISSLRLWLSIQC